MGRTETLFIYVVLPNCPSSPQPICKSANKHFVLWHNVAVHCGGVGLQRAWYEKTASRVKDAERQSAEYVMTFMSRRQTQCAVLFQRRNSETRTGNRVVFCFFFSLTSSTFCTTTSSVHYISRNMRTWNSPDQWCSCSLSRCNTDTRPIRTCAASPAWSWMWFELEELHRPC